MWGYIYKTTNLINKKIYIGQHARAKFTKKYKGSGTLIQAAMLKYGRENFIVELIERCSSQEQLDEREQYWIKKFDSRNPLVGYNQSYGGRENDSKLTYRRDFEAKELREYLNDKDPEKARMKRLNDPSNWVLLERDGKTREVFIDKIKFYTDLGWKLVKR